MIKILFFIEGLSGGGAEKVLRNLVNNMDQSKFDITVQTINKENPELYLVPGIHYKAINRARTRIGKKLFSYWFRFCAEIKCAYSLFVKSDYDIEVAYLETAATKIISQSVNINAKKIAWVHCDMSQKSGIAKNKSRLMKQYNNFEKIICVSQGVEQGFQQVFGKDYPTEVLYNVIDETEILEKAKAESGPDEEKEGAKLVAVGRLSKEKNFSYLIDTCSELKNAGYLFHLQILGEGPERNNLEKQIHDLNLSEFVELKGFCTNPYSYMKKADIIVCSSVYEGLSTVVIESLILGKAIVTTPCAGMQELLGSSEYGIIVKNTKDGLYKGLSSFLESSELLETYARKAKERGMYFSKQKLVEVTENIFCNMISDSTNGGE